MSRIKDVAWIWLFFSAIGLVIFLANGIINHDLVPSIEEYFMLSALSLLCIIPFFGLGLAVIGQLYFNIATITALVIVGYSFVMLVPSILFLVLSLRSASYFFSALF
jgi:hypothetical protein